MLSSRKILTLAAFFIGAFCACQKTETTPPPVIPGAGYDTKHEGDLLRSAYWGNTSYEFYQYNPDSSLHKTDGRSTSGAGAEREFIFRNGYLSLVYKSGAIQDSIGYRQDGLIESITETSIVLDYYGVKLEFSYSLDKKLKTMSYYSFDEFSKKLINTATYEYNNQGLPFKITSASPDGKHVGIVELEWGNTGFVVQPWLFADRLHLVVPDYEIYNLPLLRSLSRLPEKITRTQYINGVFHSASTNTIQYQVSGKRLDKVKYITKGYEIELRY
ncbi:hypothetical protein [Sediminibacterium ginsengisoli]|uniref:YD repeat-containing protein n=1 Tax=Sediminibacterium ginsengisoli TaxID=413434 RepID=A0A1T4MNR4_9BACT|nr:hypothetical protein [Sediminibacterium ginsengisoli]SJZ68652.1 hypothetical protein SAMN04488132_103491 [Sediminibacterium ginsengisoli]